MISQDAVEKAILSSANPQEKDIIRRVVAEGKNLLFNEQTHQALFDDMLGGEDVGRGLGEGIASVMLVLYDKSRGESDQAQPAPQEGMATKPTPQAATMPKGVLAPAGTILLATVAGFSGETGAAQIDDATISTALQAMYVKIYDKFESGFRDRVASKRTQQPSQPPSPTPQPQGLINTQAGA